MNNKLFVLIVKYGTGKVCTLVDTPDLYEALECFKQKMQSSYGLDKGNMLPNIISAEILPLLYESVYNKDKQ